MRSAIAGLILAIVASTAVAAEPISEPGAPVEPTLPKPLRMSIIGLSITAIAVIGARASRHRRGDRAGSLCAVCSAQLLDLGLAADRRPRRERRLMPFARPHGSDARAVLGANGLRRNASNAATSLILPSSYTPTIST